MINHSVERNTGKLVTGEHRVPLTVCIFMESLYDLIHHSPSATTYPLPVDKDLHGPPSVDSLSFCYHVKFFFFFFFSTGLVRLYIAGLPLRSCQTIGAPSVQGSAQSLYFRFW